MLLTLLFREDASVHPSPTKRYKKSIPGSPEYESQPAVVITYVTSCLPEVANDIFLKCKAWSQTPQAKAELRSVSGFFGCWLLAANSFICMCRDVDDEADKVSLTEGNIAEDEEAYLVENVHRSYVPVP